MALSTIPNNMQAPMPAGTVIQTQYVMSTTRTAISSTSYSATALQKAIAPNFANSWIYIQVMTGHNTERAGERVDFTIQRGAFGSNSAEYVHEFTAGGITGLSGSSGRLNTEKYHAGRGEGSTILSFLDVATSGQFVGPDIINKFKTEGVAKLAGLSEKLNDVAAVLTEKLGGLNDTLGGVQGQLGGALEGIQGQLPGIQDQLTGLSDTMIPQLESFATSPGVTNLGASLQQGFAGFNFGGGLIPKGF